MSDVEVLNFFDANYDAFLGVLSAVEYQCQHLGLEFLLQSCHYLITLDFVREQHLRKEVFYYCKMLSNWG